MLLHFQTVMNILFQYRNFVEILTLLLVKGKMESATRLIRRNVADKRSCLITKRDYSRYFHDQFHFVEIWWTFDFSDTLLGHEEYFQSAGYKALAFSVVPRASRLRIVLACEQALQLRWAKRDARERAHSFFAPRARVSCRVRLSRDFPWLPQMESLL